MNSRPTRETPRPIRQSLKEYGRGVIGGLLFSLPLIYSMEIWWRGFTAEPLHLIIYLILTFCILLAYNRYAGMRRDVRFYEVAIGVSVGTAQLGGGLEKEEDQGFSKEAQSAIVQSARQPVGGVVIYGGIRVVRFVRANLQSERRAR